MLDGHPPAEILTAARDAISLNILDRIQMELCMPNRAPFMLGGAVRNHFYNTVIKKPDDPFLITKDYDVLLPIGFTRMHKSFHSPFGGPKGTDECLQIQEMMFNRLQKCADIFNIKASEDSYSFANAPFKFTYKDKPVELSIIWEYAEAQSWARQCLCDAPINAVTMDINGQMFGHYDFVPHLTNGIYQYRGNQGIEHAIARMEKMRAHFPHIKGVLPPKTKIDPELREKCAALFIPEHIEPYKQTNPQWAAFAKPRWVGLQEREHFKRRELYPAVSVK